MEVLWALEEAYVDAIAGGQFVDPSTFRHARAFIEMLPSSVPAPDVSVDDDGEIGFDWDYAARLVFSVSVGRDGTLSYAGLFGHSKAFGTENPSKGFLPDPILASINRLLNH